MNGAQGKSMKNALYVQRYACMAKGTSRNEANEKIKPVEGAIELRKSEGIRQAGS